MVKKYRVVFQGLTASEKDFEQGMSCLGVSPAVVEQIISKAPVILKGGMPMEDARRYAEAVQFAGGRVNIQEHEMSEDNKHTGGAIHIRPLEDFIMCPQCGYKQLKTETCEKCGLSFQGRPQG